MQGIGITALGRLTVLVALAAAGLGCDSTESVGHPLLQVAPAEGLYDDPLSISVTGLRPGVDVTLQMRTTDASGARWSSTADYRASSSGSISDGRASGRLLSSLAPEAKNPVAFEPPHPWRLTVALLDGSRELASQTVVRQTPVADGMATETDLRPGAAGLYADLFEPSHPTPGAAAVLTVGGSEGGIYYAAQTAAALAAAGHPAMALAYFGADGLPAQLEAIPLEYFGAALRRLGAAPGVNRDRVVIWGVSRGSEAAQLTAVHYPSLVAAIVAMVPSDTVHPSLPSGTTSPWTWHDHPVPFTHQLSTTSPTDVPKARIPLENFPGPVLTVCGTKDEVWPSCDFARAIATEVGVRATSLTYPAGHLVGLVPTYPLALDGTTTGAAFGGTPSDAARGRIDEWPKILAFLDQVP